MKITRLLTAVVVAAAGSTLTAFSVGTSLHIVLSDGSTRAYALDTKPRITFGAGTVSVDSPDGVTDFNRADVKRMYFSEEAGVTSPVADEGVRLTFDGGILRAEGLKIDVYNLRGELVSTGRDEVSLTDMPRGIYVASTAQNTLKIAIY